METALQTVKNLYYVLGRPPSSALVLSPTKNKVAFAPEIAKGDTLDLRIRFYEEDSAGALTRVTLPAGAVVTITGLDPEDLTGTAYFTLNTFTLTQPEVESVVVDDYYAGVLDLTGSELAAKFGAATLQTTARVSLTISTTTPDRAATIGTTDFTVYA